VERILQRFGRFERIRPIENELLKINPLFRNPMHISLPMTGLVPFLVPARTKKMAGMGAFFGALAGCLDIRVRAGRTGNGPAFRLAGPTGSASAYCAIRGTQDMGEKYISPESPGVLRPSGVKFLLLRMDCAPGHRLPFSPARKGIEEAIGLYTRMIRRLCPCSQVVCAIFPSNDFGSSGFRPTDTTRT
jgi:hypothetical protein